MKVAVEQLDIPSPDQGQPSDITCLWKIGRGWARLQTSNPAIVSRIRDWHFAKQVAFEVMGPLRIYAIPTAKVPWVRRTLRLPIPLSLPGRVAHARQLGCKPPAKSVGIGSEKNLKGPGHEIFSGSTLGLGL